MSVVDRNRQFAVLTNVLLGGISLVFLAVLYYAMYWHRGKIFYVIGAIGFIFYVLLLLSKVKWKSNIALISIAIISSFYVAELLLTMIPDQLSGLGPEFNLKNHKPSKNFDTRSKLEVVTALRKEGIEAWPSVSPNQFLKRKGLVVNEERLFPLGGIPNKTTAHCNESGKWTIYDADEYGFRNPKRTNKPKILLVGDSYTHGACVDAGQDIAGQLRELLKEPVMNLGYAGNGPLIEFATLREYASNFRPEHVFWIYYESNDIEDLLLEQKSLLLQNYLSEKKYSQELFHRQDAIQHALSSYVEGKMKHEKHKKINKSYKRTLTHFLRLDHIRQRTKFLASTHRDLPPIFEKILSLAVAEVKAWNGKLYFVYLPANWRYRGEQRSEPYRDQVLEVVAKLNIPLLDFKKVVDNHPDPPSLCPLRQCGHLNAEGYGLVAKMFVDHLDMVENK